MSLAPLYPQLPAIRRKRGQGVVVAAWLGSTADAAAAEWARQWALSTGRRLVVLVVGAAASTGFGYRTDIARTCGVAEFGAGALDVDIQEATGSPAEVLVDASRWADVLVLPTDGPAPIADRPLGRTIEAVVTKASAPVVIVPGLYREDPDGTVVVGADVDEAAVTEMKRRVPVVRATSAAAMIAASKAATLVVARCHGHDRGSVSRPCRAIQVARSAWSPVVAVHA
ncbi:MAG: universal stress protein [Actinomycetales bacterium]|nr:universal stress protein [Candidatus Phosphoribacter baldrii]